MGNNNMEFVSGQVYKAKKILKVFIKLPDGNESPDYIHDYIPVGSLITYLSVINRINSDTGLKIYTKKFLYQNKFIYDTRQMRENPENYLELIPT